MKKLWNGFLVAFAMYSRIPVPRADWEKENMHYALLFFPLIGAVIGLLENLWYGISMRLSAGILLKAAITVMLPVLVTGGIHFDGFLDTADAMSSWREKKERLRILKDSHTGAFALIAGLLWALAALGLAGEFFTHDFPLRDRIIFALTFVISRSFSGLSVVSFPKANPDGTAAAFSRNAKQRQVGIFMLILITLLYVAVLILQPLTGLLVIFSSLLSFGYYYHLCKKYFGGMTGDLAGFFLTAAELLMMAALAAGTLFS